MPFYLILSDSYEFLAGCDRGKACSVGKTCVAVEECFECSFGTCLQQANSKMAEGFSYSISRVCRLCTAEQLKALKTMQNWAVYRKRGCKKKICLINFSVYSYKIYIVDFGYKIFHNIIVLDEMDLNVTSEIVPKSKSPKTSTKPQKFTDERDRKANEKREGKSFD